MAGLRERRHEETRRQIVDAAFALFRDRSYDAVTMDDIAAAAGVSRSTAYRRFPTKDHVVLEVPGRWLIAFDQAVDELPNDTAPADAVRAACMAVARHIDAHADTVRDAYAVLAQAPSLRTAGVATTAWLDRTVRVIQRFGDMDDETAGIVSGAHLGAIDAMMGDWAASGGKGSVAALTDTLLSTLQPLLD